MRSLSRVFPLPLSTPSLLRLRSSGVEKFVGAADMGGVYDLSDITTLFQDSAATIPVTAFGQPVGFVRDKSGKGLHATQSVAASRPTYQSYLGKPALQTDGIDDGLVTPSITWGTDEVTVVAAVRNQNTARAMIAELTNGGPYRWEIEGSNTSYNVASGGAAVVFGPGYAMAAPNTVVQSLQAKITTDLMTMRINNTTIPAAYDQGAGTNYSAAPVYIGRRGGTSLPFSGYIFGLFFVNRLLPASELNAAEEWARRLSGAY